jgi:hypothetical protein
MLPRVVICPVVVGGAPSLSIFRPPESMAGGGPIPLRLTNMERLAGDLVWLRYDVARAQ